MADYINPVIEVDASDVEDEFYTYIQSFYPDFEPRESHLATVLSEAYAQAIADTREQASDVPPEIARYFGPLFGVMPVEAASASGTVTITMTDNAGYDFDPGELLFRIRVSGDQYMGFENSGPVHIAAGANVAAGVTIVATTEGAEGNNLPGPVELVTVEDKVQSVVLTGGNTSGGADEESIDDYLDKFAGRMRLLADNVIKPEDVEQYIKSMFPDANRVLALDGYDVDTNTWNNEKTVTFAPIDSTGAALVAEHAAMVAALSALREWNFVFKAMAPTYTAVDIALTVVALPGWDPVALADNITAALADTVSPAHHGQPQVGDERGWVLEGNDRIPVSKMFQAVRNVEGVNYILNDTITVNGVANGPAMLAGVAPLPTPTPTINVVVNPAS